MPIGAVSAADCKVQCDEQPPSGPGTSPAIPPVPPSTDTPPPAADTKALARRLFDLMNQERTSRGLPAFSRRTDVDDIAVAHSKRMAADGGIWHNDDYFTPATKNRLQAAYLGENVARNADIDDMHRRLMNSPHHRDNILNPRFSQVGVGVAVGENGGLFGTENFLQPRPPAPPPAAPKAKPVDKPRVAPPPPPAPPVPAPESVVELAFPSLDMAGAALPGGLSGPVQSSDHGRSALFLALSALAALALALAAGKVTPSAVRFGRYQPGDQRARRGRRPGHQVAHQDRALVRGVRRDRGGRRA